MVNDKTIGQLVALNSETLLELSVFLTAIDQSSYTSVNPKGNASVGQHVRHTLEFYQCLLRAENVVNYDLRKRDVLIESSPEHAAHTLREILNQLRLFGSDRELTLETGTGKNGSISLELPTTLVRELFYVLEHAIHHMALIRVLIKDQHPNFELSENFGVAHSTLAHRAHLSKR